MMILSNLITIVNLGSEIEYKFFNTASDAELYIRGNPEKVLGVVSDGFYDDWMSVEDGLWISLYELCCRVNVPNFLLITAMDLKDYQLDGADYLGKPLNPRDFITKLESWKESIGESECENSSAGQE